MFIMGVKIVLLNQTYECLMCEHMLPSVDDRVWSKYTFWDQIQIHLSQIKYKCIAFLDFNSNTNTLLFFIQIRFKYVDRVSIIVQVYHSGWNFV